MNLRDRIRDLAKEKGMSLPVLESTLGFGNGTIVKWDKASPNTDKLSKVADYFGVSVDYLLGREGEKGSAKANLPLNSVYFSFAKDAQDNEIDPRDIATVLDFLIERKKEKEGK